MLKLQVLILLAYLCVSFSRVEVDNTNKLKLVEEPITVHVIPHTHDDAGWLWTLNQYFYGTGSANVSVQKILDNFVLSLYDKKDRTFIYVEMAFFTKWYQVQSEDTKLKIKELLKEGRFEFINGGFVMHDEATTYYQHYIDQMRLGLMFLQEEFNYRPDVAWFIDPFGHSAANAHILHKMGFEKVAFVRIDYQEKNKRIEHKDLEFYWKPFNSVDSKSKIFTHVTYDHYCLPQGMYGFTDDKPIKYNSAKTADIAEMIVNNLATWNTGYKHRNVMLMYGCDFTFNARNVNYENVEMIMAYINKQYEGQMKLIYSTPSRYFNTVLSQVDSWSEYQGQDFFPYAENPNSYWTGYPTSRPYLKGLVREAGNYLTTSSHFLLEYYLKNLLNPTEGDVTKKYKSEVSSQLVMRENLAICQHHDAVAGTAKELVSEDYQIRLNSSIKKIKTLLKNVVRDLLPRIRRNSKISVCVGLVTNFECQEKLVNFKKQLVIAILNPGLNGTYPISFDLPNPDYELYNSKGIDIQPDITCIDNKSFKDKYRCKLNYLQTFDQNKSIHVIILKRRNGGRAIPNMPLQSGLLHKQNNSEVNFNAETLSYQFQFNTGESYNLSLRHVYYNSFNNTNSKIRKDSSNPDGAYVFSPVEVEPIPFGFIPEESSISKGSKLVQVTLRFSQSYLIVRIFRSPFYLELESIWDPIVDRSSGKNFLLLIDSNIDNTLNIDDVSQPEFWTDSNGIKLMRRIRDYRESYIYNVTEQIAANFYPVNSMISIRERQNKKYSPKEYNNLDESDRSLHVLVDRSESVGVVKKGQIMFLENRFSVKDDWKGLEEPLFELASAGYFRIKHWAVLSNKVNQAWLNNLVNNRPAFVSVSKASHIPTKIIEELPEMTSALNKFNINSHVNRMITKSPYIVVNIHPLNEREFFIQGFNMWDPYFGQYHVEEYLNFNPLTNLKYQVTEYHFSGTHAIGEPVGIVETISFLIAPQDFKLFRITFN